MAQAQVRVEYVKPISNASILVAVAKLTIATLTTSCGPLIVSCFPGYYSNCYQSLIDKQYVNSMLYTLHMICHGEQVCISYTRVYGVRLQMTAHTVSHTDLNRDDKAVPQVPVEVVCDDFQCVYKS